MPIHYTVSRLCRKDGTADRRLVLNRTTPGDARKYGKLIEKHVHDGAYWRYCGMLTTEVSGLDTITATYGLEDTVILKRTGVDLRRWKY